MLHPRSLLRQLTARPLAEPCTQPWEEMSGQGAVRHCAACDRDVYSISDMTPIEAELRLLNAPDEVPCIRYARDAAGQVVHRLPALPASATLRRPAAAHALVIASALGGTLVTGEVRADDKGKAAPPAAAPVQCVMLTAPAVAAAAPAPPAAAPSAAAAATPAPAPPPEIPLAGAAPPPERPIAFGTLTIKSKTPRAIKIAGLALQAPLVAFRMTPGDFLIDVTDGKRHRSVKLSIKIGQLTTIDLDKK